MEFTKNSILKCLVILIQLIGCYSNSNGNESYSWIRSVYWLTVSEYPVPDIDSSLFTHLFCGFATINSATYQLSIPSSDREYFSSFTLLVKRSNPSIQTLLSIGDSRISPTFFSMISNSSCRSSFVKSSIETAITYRFNGLDLFYFKPNSTSDALNMAHLFDELRAAVDSHHDHKLMLTMGIYCLPTITNTNSTTTELVDYPVDAIQRNFDWVHMLSFDYFIPGKDKFAYPHAAMYDPHNNPHLNTDYGISQWISKGLKANKMVIGLPYHGWAWSLRNPVGQAGAIGAPASGPGITQDGSMSYKYIKNYVKSYGDNILYNSTYLQNSWSFRSFWVSFDDVEAIKAKVTYARTKGLRGYSAFQVASDDNWLLSRAAAEIEAIGWNQVHRRLILVKVLVPLGCICTLTLIGYFLRAKLLGNGTFTVASADRNFSFESPDVKVFRFEDMNVATDSFSYYNKLGEGGYGPVYKGKLKTGQQIAVKRLSKASSQGFEEFKNEVMLTARLQHVNLVKVIGFCVEREEKMLIYEYLPNGSLDSYLFDPVKCLQLDWGKRTCIIEGIVQGLLYLQEYSRLTIIHRDLKANNILLDIDLNPKISDFGMARIFQKDEYEANTSKIVGTYGFVPPEYVNQGIYSTKYDVYSFGVMLLQIISGRRHTQFYGANREYLNLLEYAYESWKEGKGMEFTDPTLDDSSSKCKLMICLQIALLCVQEKQEDRPSMLEISSMLKHQIQPVTIPKRPAFSTRPHEIYANSTTCSTSVPCSNYDYVISDLQPR